MTYNEFFELKEFPEQDPSSTTTYLNLSDDDLNLYMLKEDYHIVNNKGFKYFRWSIPNQVYIGLCLGIDPDDKECLIGFVTEGIDPNESNQMEWIEGVYIVTEEELNSFESTEEFRVGLNKLKERIEVVK